jgi:hypothetical protein
MQVWSASEPLTLPIEFATLSRVELIFRSLRRDVGTFTAYVFVNHDGPVPADAGRDHRSFAGAFTIFAPTECWGSDGHCDYTKGPVSVYDQRPPHHLTPIDVVVDITRAIRRLDNPDALTVTVHAQRLSEPEATEGVLRFTELSALAYQTDGAPAVEPAVASG